MKTKTLHKIRPYGVAGIILISYFLGLRPLLGAGPSALIEGVTLAAALMVLLGALLLAATAGIALALGKPRAQQLRRRGAVAVAALTLIVTIVGASQALAHTPQIRGADGKPLPGSIATVEAVELGGVRQWLIIRGHDVTKPVLLFLSGGPGASEAARVLRFNQALEEDYVVVIWEQRGCTKSYPSINLKSALTVDQYVADIIELTEMLRTRFDEKTITLVGHSWGTIIGARAAQARPDLFSHYVGTAQMVNVQEADQLIYDAVYEHAQRTGDTPFLQTLEAQGPPPYFGKSPIRPYSTIFGREYAVFEVPNIRDEAYRRDGDILLLSLKLPEYGWLDRAYYLLGLMNTFNAVYPQLQEMDLRGDATQFELPVTLILGRHDMNSPSQIPEAYFDLIEAPSKELIFFEDSGHGMIWEEADRFHEVMTGIAAKATQ